MATYTENYNLKMPSGQDAPDVEDFNGNAEIIDKALDAHANNFADKYDPDSTYTQGKLCIQNDALWKAKQDISVAEPWTPAHWDATTIAAELKAQAEDISDLNSSKQNIIIRNISGDLNDFLSLAFGYTASNVTNRPPGTGNGYVEVLPAVEGTLCLQRYTVYNSLIQYERWYLSGEWGEWLKTRG